MTSTHRFYFVDYDYKDIKVTLFFFFLNYIFITSSHNLTLHTTETSYLYFSFKYYITILSLVGFWVVYSLIVVIIDVRHSSNLRYK